MTDGLHLYVYKDFIMYGFFNKDGSLYKIYMPMRKKESRFVCVNSQPQGLDTLTMDVPILVICSSLKDVMSFSALNFNNAESIAPDSEVILLPAHFMALFKDRYKKIYSLLDNDETGIRKMLELKEEHNIPFIHLKLEKDLSDSIQKHGIPKIRQLVLEQVKTIQNESTS